MASEPNKTVEGAYFPEAAQTHSGVEKIEKALASKIPTASLFSPFEPKGLLDLLRRWEKGKVLKVCFQNPFGVNGDNFNIGTKVSAIAKEWNFDGTPLTLDFGPEGNVRNCSTGWFDIQVKFTTGFSSSPVGIDSSGGTMLLAVEPKKALSERKFRQIVLHEFGHALGLRHELKHAEGRCWQEFKKTELKAFYASEYGIDNEASIKFQIGSFDAVTMQENFFSLGFRRDSIMMYSLPASLYKTGSKSPCWAALTDGIHDSDKRTLILGYRHPQITASYVAMLAASGPSETAQLANAYNALILADDERRKALLKRANELPTSADAFDVSKVILEANEEWSIATFGQK